MTKQNHPKTERPPPSFIKVIVSGMLTAFVLAVLVFAGYYYLQLTEDAASTASAATQTEQIDAIVVGIAPDYPPMEFLSSNAEIIGYDVDVMNMVFDRLGEDFLLEPMKWGKKDELLESGAIDLIWSGLSITEARKQQYELSMSYLGGEQVFVVAASSGIEDVTDLAHARVAVISEEFLRPYLEALQQELDANFTLVKEYSSISAAMVALLTNEVDVTIARGATIRYHTDNSPGKFRILPEPLMETEGTGVAAKKGNQELMSRINSTLQIMYNDGSLKSIQRHWFGDD